MIGKLNEEQIEQVLLSGLIGRIGCRDDNDIYVVPVNYVYDGKDIIAHSRPGKKIQMMRRTPAVCFEVEELNSSTNWKTVIAHGTFQEITGNEERNAAMKLFVDRTIRLKISETAILPETSGERIHPRSPGNISMVVYRIVLKEKTGRFETDQ